MVSEVELGRHPCCLEEVGADVVIDRNVSPAPHPEDRNTRKPYNIYGKCKVRNISGAFHSEYMI